MKQTEKDYEKSPKVWCQYRYGKCRERRRRESEGVSDFSETS
jgi:hypothetical protein